METILATIPKILARNFKNLIRKRFAQRRSLKPKIDLNNVTWSDYQHHNMVEFLLVFFPNPLALSKFYTRRISDKGIILHY